MRSASEDRSLLFGNVRIKCIQCIEGEKDEY